MRPIKLVGLAVSVVILALSIAVLAAGCEPQGDAPGLKIEETIAALTLTQAPNNQSVTVRDSRSFTLDGINTFQLAGHVLLQTDNTMFAWAHYTAGPKSGPINTGYHVEHVDLASAPQIAYGACKMPAGNPIAQIIPYTGDIGLSTVFVCHTPTDCGNHSGEFSPLGNLGNTGVMIRDTHDRWYVWTTVTANSAVGGSGASAACAPPGIFTPIGALTNGQWAFVQVAGT